MLSRSGPFSSISTQGKLLAELIVSGLVIGFILDLIDPSENLLASALQVNSLVMQGQVWQLFTSIIVAPPFFDGVIDVAFNALFVVYLDGFFAVVYSPAEYYGTFFATAAFGNVTSLLAGPAQASFGASGGLFGLVAGLVTYDYAVNGRINMQLVSWFLLIFVVSSFLFPNIDWLAHAGGAILGLGIGYGLGRRPKEQEY